MPSVLRTQFRKEASFYFNTALVSSCSPLPISSEVYCFFTSSMASFHFLLFLFHYTMAITVPSLMSPQTAEEFSTVLTSIYNNDDDVSAAAAAAPENKNIEFIGDIAESSGSKPEPLPLVADADCNSHASESWESIPYSISVFRRWPLSGGRFARRQNNNKNFCPQPIVDAPNPPKTQQQQIRQGSMPAAVLESPRLSDLLIKATRDPGPCRNFRRGYEVAVCAPPTVPPRLSFADLLVPCRLCKFYFLSLIPINFLFTYV